MNGRYPQELVDRWAAYYDYKGEQFMESIKVEMDKAIKEDKLSRLLVVTDDMRFTTSSFQPMKRQKFFRPGSEPRLDLRPFETLMTADVFLEACFQRREELLELSLGCFHLLTFGL